MSSSLGRTNAQRGKKKESHSPDKNLCSEPTLNLWSWAWTWIPTWINPDILFMSFFFLYVQRPCGSKLGLCGSTMVVGRHNWRNLLDPWRNGVTSLQVSLMKQSIAVTYSINIMTCAMRVCTWKPHCRLIQDTQSVGMKQMKDNRIKYI